MEEKKRKITILFDPVYFDQLDEKRFKLRTSFQKIGHGLFTKWLKDEAITKQGDVVSTESPQNSTQNSCANEITYIDPSKSTWHNLLDMILERGSTRMVEAIKGNLETFAEAAALQELSRDVNDNSKKNASAKHSDEVQSIHQRARDAIQRSRRTGSRKPGGDAADSEDKRRPA